MFKKILTGSTCAIALMGSSVYAATIVDTGSGTAFGSTWGLSGGQFLAAEFSVTDATTITSIEGWLEDLGGSATIALYSDGGNVPGAELFSSGFSSTGAVGDFIWMGLSGLSWNVSAGTYWVAYEVRAGDTYSGRMQGASTNPIITEAFYDGVSWAQFDALDIGVRVSGDISAVPVPAAVWLFGSGLIGLLGVARSGKDRISSNIE